METVIDLKYPLYKPTLGGNEERYLLEAFRSTWISSKGQFLIDFEKKFAEFLGVPYALAVCNGTVALHLSLEALEIGEGDEVLVPSFTYVASVNAVRYTGATPVFIDSQSKSWLMDLDDLKRKINSRTRAVMAVHLYGHPCQMDEILEICETNNLRLIEDAAEAFGATYRGTPVGAFGDFSTFSFFGNKTITTGEGGMVCTRNPRLADRARRLRGQGLADGREYWHDLLGYNYRMTNLCAALGLAQLERAQEILRKKNEIYRAYRELLCNLPLYFQEPLANSTSSYWMVTAFVENAETREELRAYLKNFGVETRPTFWPVHQMPMYKQEHIVLPRADMIASLGLNLPSYPDLTYKDIEAISGIIRRFFSKQ